MDEVTMASVTWLFCGIPFLIPATRQHAMFIHYTLTWIAPLPN
jgi:hypothetical protein